LIILESIPGEQDFSILVLLTEIGMAMVHGSTCIGTTLLYSSNLINPPSFLMNILKYLCAINMGVGVYISGEKLIKKLGTKLVCYTNTSAFCAQFTAMAFTLFASVLGYPASTTQSYFFALVGLRIFHNQPEIIMMDKKMVTKMVIWWVTLIPICILSPIILGLGFKLIKGF